MTTAATVVPIDYSIKARALAHVDQALSAVNHDPVQIPKATNHLMQARALIAQFPDVTGGLGGISPLLLIGGGLALYLFLRK